MSGDSEKLKMAERYLGPVARDGFLRDHNELRSREDFFNAVMDAWGMAEKLAIGVAMNMGIFSESELACVQESLKR